MKKTWTLGDVVVGLIVAALLGAFLYILFQPAEPSPDCSGMNSYHISC